MAMMDGYDSVRECGMCMHRARQRAEEEIDVALEHVMTQLNGIMTMPTRNFEERLLKMAAFLHVIHDAARRKYPNWTA